MMYEKNKNISMVTGKSDSHLEVSESMEVNGKRTFGYDDPIIYKRV